METTAKNRYTEAVGRRKTAVARVRITKDSKTSFLVNNRQIEDYFPTKELVHTIKKPLDIAKATSDFKVTAVIRGGGIESQADSFALGLSRALSTLDTESKKQLKKEGLLTRDGRAKERKKFGLKKARKSPQWSKR